MAKNSQTFICGSCTYSTVKWLGCCPSCNSWDTFELKTALEPRPYRGTSPEQAPVTMVHMKTIPTANQERMIAGLEEWDRAIGGGIVPGALMILTGDPGIGKSTLLLQLSNGLAHNYRVFYFSTEESLQQIRLRAERLQCTHENLLFSDNASLDRIIATAEQERPELLIIDSIQNCYLSTSATSPGSVTALRELTFRLMRLAKEHTIAILMSGHITKEGMIAGPKTLEHMVDAVFYLQGEDRLQTRVLRSVKNRFGTVNELGFFHMDAHGLTQVPNMNEHLVHETIHSPGSVLISILEGSRPLLLELQALVIESKLSMPQRVISGIDHKQVVLIAAILEKYLHVRLSMHDIFFKVSGGFKITGNSADLGIALALLSSYFQQPLPEKSLALGEISLTGHIKSINHSTMYIKEAEKFGIKQLLLAHSQGAKPSACATQRFKNVYELLTLFSDQ